MPNINPPFRNLSLDPADMIAVNEAYDLACQTLQNIEPVGSGPRDHCSKHFAGREGRRAGRQ
jgi:hypothetical protein